MNGTPWCLKKKKKKNQRLLVIQMSIRSVLKSTQNLVFSLLILYNFNFIKKDEILLAVFVKLDLESWRNQSLSLATLLEGFSLGWGIVEAG